MSKGKAQQKREKTEERILDAFEQVLIQDGVRNLTLKAVVDQANIGKPLIYRYFGNLEGLIRAWGERRSAFAELFPRQVSNEEKRNDVKDILEDDFIAMAAELRKHPVTLEFLAEELGGDSEISAAFNEVRNLTRKLRLKRLMSNVEYTEDDNRSLIYILYAAISYLSLRSRHAPRFFDMDLRSEESWDDITKMIKLIIGNAKSASSNSHE